MVTADFSPPQQRRRIYTRDYTHLHVVGYVIADRPAAAAPLEDDVHAYAAKHQLGTVEAIYRDPHTEPGMPREGFQRCVHALRTGLAHGVIVPRPADLAPDSSERATLLATVRAAGGVVHYIDASEGARS